MSYYSNVDFGNLENDKNLNIDNSNTFVKNKFFTRSDPSQDVPGHYKNILTKSDVIDNETDLLTPAINSKDKTQMKLKKYFHPSDYNLNYSDNLRKDNVQKTGFYYNNRDVGPGRGFGNLNISNDIRYGDASRNNTKEFKETKEAQQFFDYQFQYLDKNFQDPNHIVMPIPRGGESTRKQNQLSVNTMRSPNVLDKDDERIKTIKFNY
jgi:hypothetical protein